VAARLVPLGLHRLEVPHVRLGVLLDHPTVGAARGEGPTGDLEKGNARDRCGVEGCVNSFIFVQEKNPNHFSPSSCWVPRR